MSYIFQRYTYVVGLGASTTYSNCDLFFWNLKTFLVSNGWVVKQSSDGTTVSSTSDIITSPGTGAGGMNNQNSWFVIQAPTYNGVSTRQLCFSKIQNTNTSNNYRLVTYSMQGFSTTLGYGNSPISVSNPPIAFDGIWIYNTGGNISTYYTPYNCQSQAYSTVTATNALKWFGQGSAFGNLPSLTESIWNYMFCINPSTGGFYVFSYDRFLLPINYFMYDPLIGFNPLDVDPVTIMFYSSSSNGFGQLYFCSSSGSVYNSMITWYYRPSTFTSLAQTNSINTYQAIGLFVAGYTSYNVLSYTAIPPSTSSYNGVSQDIISKQIPLFPANYAFVDPQDSYSWIPKGISSIIYLCPDVKYINATLSSGSIVRNYFSIGDSNNLPLFVIPWDSSMPGYA